MFWKNLPYWLKGGTIALILGVFLTMLSFAYLSNPACGWFDFFCPITRMAFLFSPGFMIYRNFLFNLSGNSDYSQSFSPSNELFIVWICILNLILTFAIGAIIGWMAKTRI